MMMDGFDAVHVVRSFFFAGVGVGIFTHFIPFAKENLINYGSRAVALGKDGSKQSSGKADGRPEKASHAESLPASLLRVITAGVPHSWFVHFYVLSVSLSVFWGWSLATKGEAFLMVSKHVDTSASAPSMKMSQVQIVWLLMLVQGLRRLSESIAFMKRSASRMPWSIYGIGIAYYLNMSLAVWIEGTKAVLNTPGVQFLYPLPSIRTTIGLVVFTLASGFQYDCHAYLASLPKYTLPVHPAFHNIVCPHYTAECILYVALAFIAAPEGHMFNKTLLSNVVFVVVNLGIVAEETKTWSERKFGKEKVEARARMIPFVW